MFEHFTEPARRVIVHAQQEARALAHNYIGTEHILLGLLREQDAVTERVFSSFGVTLENVRAQVGQIIGQGDGEPAATGQIPFTPRAKKILELSLKYAVRAEDREIQPQHLLLGLLEEAHGVAARILLDIAPLEAFRAKLTGGRASRPALRRLTPELQALAFGWLLFAVSLGSGILIGWAIWD